MKILITSDDGYKSASVRSLISLFKEHELTVVATKGQQSASGAKLNVVAGGEWGRELVDGVEAFWVDGSPGDAMEFTRSIVNKKFDLILSGLNFGANVGSTLASGTVSGALHGVNLLVAPHLIALSLDMSFEEYHKDTSNHVIDHLLEYPGPYVKEIVIRAVEKNYWGAQALNINFPAEKAKGYKFASPYRHNILFYAGSIKTEGSHFSYADRGNTEFIELRKTDDVRLMRDGFITITPIKIDTVDDIILGEILDSEVM